MLLAWPVPRTCQLHWPSFCPRVFAAAGTSACSVLPFLHMVKSGHSLHVTTLSRSKGFATLRVINENTYLVRSSPASKRRDNRRGRSPLANSKWDRRPEQWSQWPLTPWKSQRAMSLVVTQVSTLRECDWPWVTSSLVHRKYGAQKNSITGCYVQTAGIPEGTLFPPSLRRKSQRGAYRWK